MRCAETTDAALGLNERRTLEEAVAAGSAPGDSQSAYPRGDVQ